MVPEDQGSIEEFDDEIDSLAAQWIADCAETEAASLLIVLISQRNVFLPKDSNHLF
jgi:hypothetical protein